MQSPIAIDPDGEPEPELAIVAETPDDYLKARPTTALLVVVVSDSTLALDQRKAEVYARAKVLEYWIPNLADGVLDVHRQPVETAEGAWTYAEIKLVKSDGTLRPKRLEQCTLDLGEWNEALENRFASNQRNGEEYQPQRGEADAQKRCGPSRRSISLASRRPVAAPPSTRARV